MSMKLIELGGFETVPAISTGNLVEDNISNAKLFKKLLQDGEKTGFYPVFVKKNYEFDYFWLRLNDSGVDSTESYGKKVSKMLERADSQCFEVWQGRTLYNYWLDGCDSSEDYKGYMGDLIPPTSDEYNNIFQNAEETEYFGLYDEEEIVTKYAENFIHFEDYVIVLLPIKNSWEALAWFPMGDFNWCPEPEYQIALAKELFQKYGARIMFIGMDRLTFYLEKPLMNKDELEAAAKTLIIADNDNYSDYEVTIKDIMGKHSWQLWWD